VLRSVAWDVRISRDMAIAQVIIGVAYSDSESLQPGLFLSVAAPQARADLLLADAAVTKVETLAAVRDEEGSLRMAEAVRLARTEQQRRFRAAQRLLSDTSSLATLAAAAKPPPRLRLAGLLVLYTWVRSKALKESIGSPAAPATESAAVSVVTPSLVPPAASSHGAYVPSVAWWEGAIGRELSS